MNQWYQAIQPMAALKPVQLRMAGQCFTQEGEHLAGLQAGIGGDLMDDVVE